MPPTPPSDFDGPLVRIGHTLVYDAVNKRVIMVGGSSRVGESNEDMWQQLGDAWAFDLAENEWLRLVPPKPK